MKKCCNQLRKDYPVIIEYRLNRTITVGTTAFTRGYCGVHQHYPSFDIIDMGGRMYDPTIGRFISPDPYIQDWENSQNFNRYSYCLNNPLKYTDPSGEFWLEFGLGITISAIANGLSTKWLFGGNFWKGAAVGAISYPIGYGVSSILSRIPIYGSIPGMLFEGSLKGISSGVIGGISNKILDNGSFWEGFAVNAVIGARIKLQRAVTVERNHCHTCDGYHKTYYKPRCYMFLFEENLRYHRREHRAERHYDANVGARGVRNCVDAMSIIL